MSWNIKNTEKKESNILHVHTTTEFVALKIQILHCKA